MLRAAQHDINKVAQIMTLPFAKDELTPHETLCKSQIWERNHGQEWL
jgi:hypothetical protein